MTYRGQVKNGKIVLEEKAALPEGAKVRVEVLVEEKQRPTASKLFLKYAGRMKGLPSDLARNHDHYLHGAPKK
jgi:hypothetical protein